MPGGPALYNQPMATRLSGAAFPSLQTVTVVTDQMTLPAVIYVKPEIVLAVPVFTDA